MASVHVNAVKNDPKRVCIDTVYLNAKFGELIGIGLANYVTRCRQNQISRMDHENRSNKCTVQGHVVVGICFNGAVQSIIIRSRDKWV